VNDGTPAELDPAKQASYIARKPEMLESQVILTSFGKLVAQAYMLGEYNRTHSFEEF